MFKNDEHTFFNNDGTKNFEFFKQNFSTIIFCKYLHTRDLSAVGVSRGIESQLFPTRNPFLLWWMITLLGNVQWSTRPVKIGCHKKSFKISCLMKQIQNLKIQFSTYDLEKIHDKFPTFWKMVTSCRNSIRHLRLLWPTRCNLWGYRVGKSSNLGSCIHPKFFHEAKPVAKSGQDKHFQFDNQFDKVLQLSTLWHQIYYFPPFLMHTTYIVVHW